MSNVEHIIYEIMTLLKNKFIQKYSVLVDDVAHMKRQSENFVIVLITSVSKIDAFSHKVVGEGMASPWVL